MLKKFKDTILIEPEKVIESIEKLKNFPEKANKFFQLLKVVDGSQGSLYDLFSIVTRKLNVKILTPEEFKNKLRAITS
jgi:hypothetical protein